MAWLEPDTEWSAGDRLTHSDWNRICGNLNYLAGDSALKTDWTDNDFLTLEAWKAVTARVVLLSVAAGLATDVIDNRITAQNIEAIEQATAASKRYFDLVTVNKKYPLYTGQVYTGTSYVRG